MITSRIVTQMCGSVNSKPAHCGSGQGWGRSCRSHVTGCRASDFKGLLGSWVFNNKSNVNNFKLNFLKKMESCLLYIESRCKFSFRDLTH